MDVKQRQIHYKQQEYYINKYKCQVAINDIKYNKSSDIITKITQPFYILQMQNIKSSRCGALSALPLHYKFINLIF